MKYRCGYKVTCRVYLEVEADCIEDAMAIADDEMTEIDIGEHAEDFEWEGTSVEQCGGMLEAVYGNMFYKRV